MTETISHFAVRQLHPNHEEHLSMPSRFAVSIDDRKRLRVEVRTVERFRRTSSRNPKRSVVPLARSFGRCDQFRGHQNPSRSG